MKLFSNGDMSDLAIYLIGMARQGAARQGAAMLGSARLGKARQGKVNAAYHCRIKGLSEFVWLYSDGAISTFKEKVPMEGAWLEKIVGERLTDKGRAARALSHPEPMK